MNLGKDLEQAFAMQMWQKRSGFFSDDAGCITGIHLEVLGVFELGRMLYLRKKYAG